MSELLAGVLLVAATLLPFVTWLTLICAGVRSLESRSGWELDERVLLSPRRRLFVAQAAPFPA